MEFIERPYIVIGATSQHRLIRSICALIFPIAGRRADHTCPVAALEVGLAAMLSVRDTRLTRLVRPIWAVLDAVTRIELRYAAAIIALEFGGAAGPINCSYLA